MRAVGFRAGARTGASVATVGVVVVDADAEGLGGMRIVNRGVGGGGLRIIRLTFAASEIRRSKRG